MAKAGTGARLRRLTTGHYPRPRTTQVSSRSPVTLQRQDKLDQFVEFPLGPSVSGAATLAVSAFD